MPGAGGGGEDTKKSAGASAEQQDLFDLILPPRKYPQRKPYFGPEDVARG